MTATKKHTTKMIVTILGCGTSVGAPMIGMQNMPQYKNPKNRRMRSSCLIEPQGRGGPAILIDTSPDLREQAIRFFPQKNPRLDAVLITHSHADHLHGLDDIRPFNFYQKNPIPLYAEAQVLEDIKTKFSYIFSQTQEGGGKPKINLISVLDQAFTVAGEKVQPLPLEHGNQSCLGFRIRNIAYLTDCSYIPPPSMSKLKGLELLILDCLRPKAHPTHFNVETALSYAKQIGAKKTVFTHMGHELEYEEFRKSLPRGMQPAYDGMQFRL